MYQLPTRRPGTSYRGKYPQRICSVGYSRSASQCHLAEFLELPGPGVHLELNDGTRYIIACSNLKIELAFMMGYDLCEVMRHPVTAIEQLSWERYNELLVYMGMRD